MKYMPGAPSRKRLRLGKRSNCVLTPRKQQFIQNAAFCKESFVHLSDTNMSGQRFQNRLVHEFCGLKAIQMSKICASSHEYPYVEKKSRIFREQNFKYEANNKQLDSEDTRQSDN